ncbi:MAG: mechanosensitive ion channel family protein [Gemmatimonadota bacterium]
MKERSLLEPFEAIWGRILDFLPNFIAAVVLFVVGISIAWGARYLVIKVLDTVDWEKMAGRASAFRLLGIGDIRYPLFDLVGAVVFWVVILAFAGTAAHALGLTFIENLLDRIVSFLPNLLLALAILGLGIWLGLLSGRFARAFAASAGIQEAKLIGSGIRYLIIIVAAGTALEQLSVATRFLFGAFLIVLGSLGLAFGLGGRDKAREIIERVSRAEEK